MSTFELNHFAELQGMGQDIAARAGKEAEAAAAQQVANRAVEAGVRSQYFADIAAGRGCSVGEVAAEYGSVAVPGVYAAVVEPQVRGAGEAYPGQAVA
jgi:hypothetical protein